MKNVGISVDLSSMARDELEKYAEQILIRAAELETKLNWYEEHLA